MKLKCPRCERSVSEEFYGPCAQCRTALMAAAVPPPPEDDDDDW